MKKLLALVLALVMTLSLCTISNAAYSDAKDVDYKEAVDVMSAVGVFQGADGKFSPKAELTREQAAKLIAYLDLGESVAEALPAVKVFNDVEANRWSAKYVAYCADAGYLAGVGDNNFDPAGKLTGYAFGKLLLCALGYDAEKEEFTGSAWTIKVAKLMESEKLAKSVSGSPAATLTREAAAQYCLNAIQLSTITYSGNGTVITYEEGTDKIASITSAVAGVASKTGTKLMTKLYSTKLVNRDNSNGTHTWLYKNDTVITVGDDNLVATYTGAVTAADLYSAGIKAADTVKVYVNGDTTGSNYTLNVIRGNKTDAKKNFTEYDGATIELYKNAAGKVDTIAVTMPYLAKVTNVYAETASKDAFIKLKVYKDSSTGADAYVYAEGFAKDDYVLYAPAGNTLSTSKDAPAEEYVVLEAAEAVVSTVSAYNTTKANFTVDGTAYTYSDAAKVVVAVNAFDVKNGTTYKFFMDKNDTVLGCVVDTEGTTTLNYVYLQKAQATSENGKLLNGGEDAMKVKVTYLDGTTETLNYALKTASSAIAQDAPKVPHAIAKGDKYFEIGDVKYDLATYAEGVGTTYLPAGVYSYTTNDNGEIKLSTTLTSTGTTPTTAALVANTKTVVVTKGKAPVTVADGTNYVATTSTKLVLAKGSTVTTYDGYKNFPSTSGTTYTVSGDVKIVVVTTGSSTKTLSNILVIGVTAATDDTADDYVVYVGTGDVTNDGTYQKFFVNGEVKSYLISDDSTVKSFSAKTVYGLTLDDDGEALVTTATQTSFEVKAKTDAYLAGTSAAYYVTEDGYTAYDVEATSDSDWTDADVEVGDTVTVVYKHDGNADVDNILAVFVTTNKAEA